MFYDYGIICLSSSKQGKDQSEHKRFTKFSNLFAKFYRRTRLELSLQLQHSFQEIIYILDSMEELKLRLLTDDYGKHLLGVEDLLQKHSLVEADINVLGERVKQVFSQCLDDKIQKRLFEREKLFQVVQNSLALLREESDEDYKPCDPGVIVERVQGLESAYEELV